MLGAPSATAAPAFLNASRSSGVAEAGWRGRGFCTDQSIAFSASQPRWGKTAASPSSPAIQAATLGPDHRPPSDGGVASRSGNRARSAGLSTLGTPPLRRRRSPRASGPCALAEMLLTEMKDAALLRLVALDLGAAMEG